MKKRILSFVMCLIMVISLMPMSVLAADEHVHDGDAFPTLVEEAAAAPSAEDVAEAAVCTCESDDPASHAPFCALYTAPEAPVCFCVEQCAEGSVNEWCDVCYFDHAACAASGEEEAAVYGWLVPQPPEAFKQFFTLVIESYELELCVGQEGRLPYTFEWNPTYTNNMKDLFVVPYPTASLSAQKVDLHNDQWTIRGLKAGEARFRLQVNNVLTTQTWVDFAEFIVTVYDHSYANGFCTRCGAYEPAKLVDGYYQIGNGGQMFWFANHINTVDNTASAMLTADIDLKNRAWTPMGTEGSNAADGFRGTFDGNGKTISGLNVTAADNGVGFFGEVRDGTVKNFTISGEVKLIGKHNYVGGVIGSACGTAKDKGATISGITSYVNVTLGEGSHGSNHVAGLVGYVNHNTNVENCAWYGTLDLGPYRAQDGVGGLVGKANSNYCGTIRNCGAYGTIKTSYQSLSFNNFDTIYIGGIVSNSLANAQTKIENCVWAGTIVNNTNLGTKAHISSVGTLNGFASVTGCYVLNNAPYVTTNGAHDSYATSVTAEQLASGEVAYKLGSAWGQTIGTNNYPVLGGAKVNYGYASCGDNAVKVYSNGQVTDTKPAHNWTEKNGVCTICGYECTVHSYENGECTVCGTVCAHIFENYICTVCGYKCIEHSWGEWETVPMHAMVGGGPSPENHKHSCAICGLEEKAPHTFAYVDIGWGDTHRKVCTECPYKDEQTRRCSGGTATCTEKAICQYCGASYGELNSHNYTNGFCTACGDYEPAELVDGYYEIGNAGQLYWFRK